MANIDLPDLSLLWSSTGDILKPSDSKIQQGWSAEVPPRQWFNWLDNRQDQAIAHIAQHGISVWNENLEYQANKSYVQGSDGLIYRAVQTNTNQNPVTDTARTYWNKDYNTGTLINIQTFTSSGTYTPTTGMKTVIFEVRGAGGGSAGANATNASQYFVAGGAGGGAKAIGKFTSVDIGASKVVTVGIGGTGGSIGGNIGNNGGTSSVGSLISAAGGFGGPLGNLTTLTANIAAGGLGGSAIVGGNLLSEPGQCGGVGQYVNNSFRGGIGGGPAGGIGGVISDTTPPAGGLGSGAAGHVAGNSQAARAGGNGGNGYVIAWEYS